MKQNNSEPSGEGVDKTNLYIYTSLRDSIHAGDAGDIWPPDTGSGAAAGPPWPKIEHYP